ncbi:MAG TPA: hypothetical protein VGA40_01015 [Candidatus Acidoferrales bacterium]
MFLVLYTINYVLTPPKGPGGYWEMICDVHPTRIEEILYLLNGPAMLGLPYGRDTRADLADFAITLLVTGGIVFLFWFWIASLLDRRRAPAPPPGTPYRIARSAFAAVGLFVCGLFVWWGVEAWGVWYEPGWIPQILGLWGLIGGCFLLRSLWRWVLAPVPATKERS